jgi:hypothetical protein
MLIFFFITIFLFLFYLSFKFVIFIKIQKDKTCKVCYSPDTERVARKSWMKKYILPKNVYKYWCRKCGNNFYHKQSNY